MPRPGKKIRIKKIRCFVGLGFPCVEAIQPLRQRLDKLGEDPAAKLRQVDDANLHLTLKFLGAIPEPDLDAVKASLAEVAAKQEPLPLQARSIGVFRNSVWLGIADNPALTALATELDSAFLALGVRQKNKTFTPHVTIARLQSGARLNLSALLEEFRETFWGEFKTRKVSLYRSETLQEGARYTIIKKFPLGED